MRVITKVQSSGDLYVKDEPVSFQPVGSLRSDTSSLLSQLFSCTVNVFNTHLYSVSLSWTVSINTDYADLYNVNVV